MFLERDVRQNDALHLTFSVKVVVVEFLGYSCSFSHSGQHCAFDQFAAVYHPKLQCRVLCGAYHVTCVCVSV